MANSATESLVQPADSPPYPVNIRIAKMLIWLIGGMAAMSVLSYFSVFAFSRWPIIAVVMNASELAINEASAATEPKTLAVIAIIRRIVGDIPSLLLGYYGKQNETAWAKSQIKRKNIIRKYRKQPIHWVQPSQRITSVNNWGRFVCFMLSLWGNAWFLIIVGATDRQESPRLRKRMRLIYVTALLSGTIVQVMLFVWAGQHFSVIGSIRWLLSLVF